MYDFELELKTNSALVIFTGQLEGDDNYYGEQIDSILKRRNFPYNVVIFLFPKYIQSKISELRNQDSKLNSNLTRAQKADQIHLVTFDGYANLELFHTLKNQSSSAMDFGDVFANKLIRDGRWRWVKAAAPLPALPSL